MLRLPGQISLLLLMVLGGCTPTNNPQPRAPSAALPSPVPASATSASPQSEKESQLIDSLQLSVAALRKSLESGGEISRHRAVARSEGPQAGDVLVRNKVRTRLQDDPGVPAMSLDVEVEKGRVILTGRVGQIEELQRALLAAFSVPEVSDVTSRLTVQPDDGSGETKGDASSAPAAK